MAGNFFIREPFAPKHNQMQHKANDFENYFNLKVEHI